MELKKRVTEELKKIIEKDYGTLLLDNEANELGVSLLRLTRLAIVVSEKNDKKQFPTNIRIQDRLEHRVSKSEENRLGHVRTLRYCDDKRKRTITKKNKQHEL